MKTKHSVVTVPNPVAVRKKKLKSHPLRSLYQVAVVGFVVVCLFFIFYYYYYFHVASTPTATTTTTTTISWPTSMLELRSLFQALYGPFTGYYLTDAEKKTITDLGGEYSYGEITLETGMRLLHDVFHISERDVLYDLGSGIGKFIIQSYLFSNVSRAIGIELSPRRSMLAAKALDELVAHSVVPSLALDLSDVSVPRKLSLVQGNFLDHDLSDATHIYICSTCFPDELLDKIYKKLLAECRSGLLVLTLVEFLDSHPEEFQLLSAVVLPMSWSTDTIGFLYEKM